MKDFDPASGGPQDPLAAPPAVSPARSLSPARHPSPAGEHLASRFARGEIDADEFERRVEVLRHVRFDRRAT